MFREIQWIDDEDGKFLLSPPLGDSELSKRTHDGIVEIARTLALDLKVELA
jgi:hypothetical protein